MVEHSVDEETKKRTKMKMDFEIALNILLWFLQVTR